MTYAATAMALSGLFVAAAIGACASPSDGEEQMSTSSGLRSGCGSVLATIDGEPAYSNGAFQTTGSSCAGVVTYGLGYQCVELAQRYFARRYGFAPVWAGVASAYQMCNAAPNAGAADVHRHDGYVPVHGDLIVFGSGAGDGHVAVVDSANGSGVEVVEQNSSATGRSTRTLGTERCFIHARANTGVVNSTSGGASSDPCANMAFDSWYCGGHKWNGDPNVARECVGGTTRQTLYCPNGCQPLAGADPDYCIGDGDERCSCDGIELGGNPIHTEECGKTVCGTDHQLWRCGPDGYAGFTPVGRDC